MYIYILWIILCFTVWSFGLKQQKLHISTPLLFEMIETMKSVHDKLLVSINFNFLNLFHKFWF